MVRGRTSRALLAALGVIAAVCALSIPVRTQGPGNSQGLHIGQYKNRQVADSEALVKFVEGAQDAQLSQDFDLDRDDPIGDGSIRRIHSRSHNVDTLLAKLADLPEVQYAEPNYILYALATPNDYYFPLLWGLANTGQIVNGVAGTAGADIEATRAWDTATGSTANVVTVVDTGIDYAHPDLAANVWSAPSAFQVTIGGRPISCSAGSHGFNAITNLCDPMDDNGHGTHVSGTIGAVGNNTTGVVGVNWIASIMGAKFLDSTGSGTTSNAINAIEFAIQTKQLLGADANVRVLSNSWGGGGSSQALLGEINKANDANMLFTAAAGNSGTNNDTTPFYPANYTAANVIAVAATDNRDNLASFSNYGATTVDLGAPGVYIASTYPGNQYVYMSGTSMATPHVSGAAALVLSVCGALDTAGLRSVLLANTDPLSSLAGKTVTGGRLNVFKAVSSCVSAPPLQPDFSVAVSPSSRTIRRGQSTTYTATITPSNGFLGNVSLHTSASPVGLVLPQDSSVSIGSGSAKSSVLGIGTTSSTTRTTYTITVTGTGTVNGSSVSRSSVVTLRVR